MECESESTRLTGCCWRRRDRAHVTAAVGKSGTPTPPLGIVRPVRPAQTRADVEIFSPLELLDVLSDPTAQSLRHEGNGMTFSDP